MIEDIRKKMFRRLCIPYILKAPLTFNQREFMKNYEKNYEDAKEIMQKAIDKINKEGYNVIHT